MTVDMTSISFAAGITQSEAASQGWNGADTVLKRPATKKCPISRRLR
jgi:hypothetical protein